MNGIEFVKEIRKLDKDIAIIVMSAFDLKELAIEAWVERQLTIVKI
jgi:two-component SAPR family response regulator